MSCIGFEERIALYVEGDVSDAELRHVQAHLDVCLQCRSLAAELRESLSVFKAMRQEWPDSSALRAVRERVLAKVAAADSRMWLERILFGGLRRRAALAAIALFAVGGGAVWFAGKAPDAPIKRARIATTLPPAPLVVALPSDIPSATPQAGAPPVVRSARRAIEKPAAVEIETPVVKDLPEGPDAPANPPEQIAIKFLTDDPNVIIYWLIDAKGD